MVGPRRTESCRDAPPPKKLEKTSNGLVACWPPSCACSPSSPWRSYICFFCVNQSVRWMQIYEYIAYLWVWKDFVGCRRHVNNASPPCMGGGGGYVPWVISTNLASAPSALFLSGWNFLLNLLYAFLISASDADRSTLLCTGEMAGTTASIEQWKNRIVCMFMSAFGDGKLKSRLWLLECHSQSKIL